MSCAESPPRMHSTLPVSLCSSLNEHGPSPACQLQADEVHGPGREQPKCLGCARAIYSRMTNVPALSNIKQPFYDGLRFCGPEAPSGHSGNNLFPHRLPHLHICFWTGIIQRWSSTRSVNQHLHVTCLCAFQWQGSFAPMSKHPNDLGGDPS